MNLSLRLGKRIAICAPVAAAAVALALSGSVTAQEKTTAKPAPKSAKAKTTNDAKPTLAPDEEIVEVEASDMDENVRNGTTVLTGNVSIIRESGYLYADKVTLYRDPDSSDKSVQSTVADGNVRLKDDDLVGTCDHAEFKDGNNMIELVGSQKNPAVVLQEQDRYEAPRFTYDRRTGRRTASGGVKLRVRVKKSEPETPAPTTDTANPAATEPAASETTTTDGK